MPSQKRPGEKEDEKSMYKKHEEKKLMNSGNNIKK